MHSPRGSRRFLGVISSLLLLVALTLGLGSFAPTSAQDEPPAEPGTAETTPPPGAEDSTLPPGVETQKDEELAEEPGSEEPKSPSALEASVAGPYGADHPVTVEANFSRPDGSYMGAKDFSLLNDLERLIRGTYKDPNTGQYRSVDVRTNNFIRISVSRMENSHRVGRELVAAAKHGVQVSVIHGVASQSKESRSLASQLTKITFKGKRTGHFHICEKGKSNACLSTLKGAIMHTKILVIRDTFRRNGDQAFGAVWTGSANLGGPSGEYTFNNGWTVYNDQKLYMQLSRAFLDMWNERNVGNDYVAYVRDHRYEYGSDTLTGKYGYTYGRAVKDGTRGGVFYSNLSNLTYYLTPILATPSNGRDPVLNLLNRVVPDDRCQIRLQQNRFKYRRIAVAQKLKDLSDAGCRVSMVAFRDEIAANRTAHCQQWLRICKPILDALRGSSVHVDAAWAKPHDKTTMVEAVLLPNKFNQEERTPNGDVWPSGGTYTKIVQAGSAALTGSNLVVSDEVTTESLDPEIYDQYLDHWRAITRSKLYREVLY